MEENNEVILPEAKNPLNKDTADKMAALIKLDISKYESEAKKAQLTIAQAELLIAQSRIALADLERRVLNVDYPPVPKEEDETKPQMGEPVKTESEQK